MNWQRYTLTADTAPSITLTKTPPSHATDGLARVRRVTQEWAQMRGGGCEDRGVSASSHLCCPLGWTVIGLGLSEPGGEDNE